jgi:hypothetical protein
MFAPIIMFDGAEGFRGGNPDFIEGAVDKFADDVEASASTESRLLFRSMKKGEDGNPEVGIGSRYLGARMPPNDVTDITPDENGLVHPGEGGMSASPDTPYNLDIRHRPPEYGGKGKDPVWCISECDLGPDLHYDPYEPTHGFVEPSYTMPSENYQQAIIDTREKWKLLHGE